MQAIFFVSGVLLAVAFTVAGGIAWMAIAAKRAMNRNDNR